MCIPEEVYFCADTNFSVPCRSFFKGGPLEPVPAMFTRMTIDV